MQARDIAAQMRLPECFHEPLQKDYPCYSVSIATDVGSRKHQEDRCTFAHGLSPADSDSAFFGIFDGTVGDFASENVKDLVVPHLLGGRSWVEVEKLVGRPQEGSGEALVQALAQAMREMYLNSDRELVEMCKKEAKHYASSTSVTVMCAFGYLVIGHLGDSRAALGFERHGTLAGEFLTVDHKPDAPEERRRIVTSGGSVEYLHNHNNKPFIRGGDFTMRKQAGEQPMQLQYSRAFGGKDLKMFGLSCEPDVSIVQASDNHKVLILASDGLWDVYDALTAVSIAWRAMETGDSPAEALVRSAVDFQKSRQANADNITAIVAFFRHGARGAAQDGRQSAPASSSDAPPQGTPGATAADGDAQVPASPAEENPSRSPAAPGTSPAPAPAGGGGGGEGTATESPSEVKEGSAGGTGEGEGVDGKAGETKT
uniref:PPM-type phosphatase domain-containing protein n=1 Tax=Chromera velia CCMP2878 TaxID=1169474 RepID=A0A0G4I7H7_9ALVE|eukprot:Cvel_11643.t1-p1 / transcript=Cvel_11643.t1 / gene=Cvel_11643 / organism=Chromera_velia_CCMP2878 / gene_product=Probable protein phosphatase 2C 2, putative / transcript_product=Probable protein phosphatase 2C 2, putative / location=Cvel_scaffold737:54104-57644(-) / protein_length=427 / sequence_SO=supercontig / SO=protein_coding / is_pseudo=false